MVKRSNKNKKTKKYFTLSFSADSYLNDMISDYSRINFISKNKLLCFSAVYVSVKNIDRREIIVFDKPFSEMVGGNSENGHIGSDLARITCRLNSFQHRIIKKYCEKNKVAICRVLPLSAMYVIINDIDILGFYSDFSRGFRNAV